MFDELRRRCGRSTPEQRDDDAHARWENDNVLWLQPVDQRDPTRCCATCRHWIGTPDGPYCRTSGIYLTFDTREWQCGWWIGK